MLIEPPETMPIATIDWSLRQPGQVNRSGWTGRRQTSAGSGPGWWSCSVEFRSIRSQAEARKWRGFFASLEGVKNSFPVVAVEAAQHAGAEPTVASGAAGAATLVLTGTIPELQQGDYMTVKLTDGTYQLVCLTEAISGSTAKFRPELRNTAATGAGSVVTVLPFAHVAMPDDAFSYRASRGQIYDFAFSAEEAF